MERCHLYLPLTDSSGGLYSYAEVTLLDEETGRPIQASVYLDPIGGAPQVWPVLIDPAVISLWTDEPMRVVVQALLPGGVTLTRSGVDIMPAPSVAVRSAEPLHIGSSDGIDGPAVLAVSPDGTANWQLLDVLRTHQHAGDAPASTVLGPANLTDIYPEQTWLGSTSGAVGAAQGPASTAVGQGSRPGPRGVALGGATAASDAVALGAFASAGGDSTSAGETASAPGEGQSVLGQHSAAQAAVEGAVVLGAHLAADVGEVVALQDIISVFEDGTVVIGRGPLPDYQGLTGDGDVFLTLLGNVLAPRYLATKGDAVLAGSGSKLGFYSPTGVVRPMLTSSGVTVATPGRAALLSLLAALDQLGLVYLLDGAVDDELADWTKTFAHDANAVLETGNSDGSKGGDLSRMRRNAAGSATVTYRKTSSALRDFAFNALTWNSGGTSPTNIATTLLAHVSADNATWTPVPVAWQTPTATAAGWYRTWVSNARPLPADMQYLRLTITDDPSVSAPQIGRIIVR